MITTVINRVSIKKIINDQLLESDDELAVEEPLEIRLCYVDNNNRITKSISVTMRTPRCDDELSAGFLFTEGIINNYDQLKQLMLLPFRKTL